MMASFIAVSDGEKMADNVNQTPIQVNEEKIHQNGEMANRICEKIDKLGMKRPPSGKMGVNLSDIYYISYQEFIDKLRKLNCADFDVLISFFVDLPISIFSDVSWHIRTNRVPFNRIIEYCNAKNLEQGEKAESRQFKPAKINLVLADRLESKFLSIGLPSTRADIGMHLVAISNAFTKHRELVEEFLAAENSDYQRIGRILVDMRDNLEYMYSHTKITGRIFYWLEIWCGVEEEFETESIHS